MFQSTPPAWGATVCMAWSGQYLSVSIHAPRMGSDACGLVTSPPANKFQSTPPAWGATVHNWEIVITIWFQSTPPAWGATKSKHSINRRYDVSIHAPRMGSDKHASGRLLDGRVSIHAPRMGSDRGKSRSLTGNCVSIHAPRMGSDVSYHHTPRLLVCFNPRPPHGERLAHNSLRSRIWLFQSTPPAWGATTVRAAQGNTPNVSIHAPRMGSDFTSCQTRL